MTQLARLFRLPILQENHRAVDDFGWVVALPGVLQKHILDSRENFPIHLQAGADMVSGYVVHYQPENGVCVLRLQRVLRLGSYETAWTWLHKLRRTMVSPGRD